MQKWSERINEEVERVLKKRGITDFVLIASSGEDVTVSVVGCCRDCLTRSVAGGMRAFPGLRGLMTEALVLSEGSEAPLLMN